MKFRAKIRLTGTDHWFWETFEVNCDDPKQYVRDLLEDFNATLRPGERPRTYGGILKIIDNRREHEWEKTNLVTIAKKGQMYDTAKCKNCPATSKRFGISGTHVRDKKYRAKKWERCR